MKPLAILICLFAVFIAAELRAENATNTRQLEEQRALSFASVRKVLVAKLAVPVTKEEAVFRGCALRSEWKEVATSEAQALADLLSALISNGIGAYTQAGDDDIIWLQPLGFVYGEVGIRLETDKGRREFSITRGKQRDYVYAYDIKKHTMCFAVEGPLRGKLGKVLPYQLSEPMAASGRGSQ